MRGLDVGWERRTLDRFASRGVGLGDGTDDGVPPEWENARGVQGGNAMTDARQDPAQIAAAVISTLFTSTEKGREAAEVVEPDVLELRLHGVANTSPQDLLDLPREEIELAAGDQLGSFWQPTPIALLRRSRARGEPILDRGEIPAGVHREAYSWGGMVRTTGDRGFGGAIVAGLARAGWALLLPFSMANTAIWSMQLRMRLPDDLTARRSARAFVMRVAGVFLTLVLVASTSVVALDIVALQCFGGQAKSCPGLPGALDSALADRSLGVRLAVLSLVPVIMIGGLWWLARSSRVRYDVADRFNVVGRTHAWKAPDSVFADPRYWLRDGETGRLASMHFAAGVGLVATILFTTWDGAHELALVGQIGFWISLIVTLAAVMTAGATATLPFERKARTDPPAAKPRGRWHRAVVIAALSTWVGAGVAQVIAKDAWTGLTLLGPFSFRMSEVAIVGLLIVLLALVVVAACFSITKPRDGDADTPGLQHDRRYRAWHGRGPAVFLGMAVGTGMIWSSLIVVGLVSWLNGSITSGDLLSGGGSGTAEAQGVAAPSVYAWFGLAALTVFAAIGIPVGIALICKRRLRTRLDVWATSEKGRATPRYERRRSLGRTAAEPLAPAAAAPAPGVGGRTEHIAEAPIDAIWVGGRPGDDDPLRPGSPEEIRRLLADRISAKESAAARLHLAEHYAGIFAVGAMIALGIALVGAGISAIGGQTGNSWLDAPIAFLRERMSPVLALMLAMWTVLAIAVMSALVFGGSKTERPLAVIWDLSCFLPTAGHPLGPPTYLDRAAPEIARRLLWWLRDDPTTGSRAWANPADRAGTGNVAVLVAHSMGAVLGTAALMLLTTHEDGERLRKRISFLSYGVQLRAYFGRFFPELLGPDALGVTPCVGPRLFAFDPWRKDFEEARAEVARRRDAAQRPLGDEPDRLDEAAQIIQQGEGNPTRMPVHDWISLWRGNDELGFPAFSNDPDDNRIDRIIEEFDATGYTAAVATHGEYIRSPRYIEALLELADGLRVVNSGSRPDAPEPPGGR